MHVLAADTDGIDGVEDNAGAITPDTLARARAQGMKAQGFSTPQCLRLLRAALRPRDTWPDLYQRQRFPRC